MIAAVALILHVQTWTHFWNCSFDVDALLTDTKLWTQSADYKEKLSIIL